MLSENIFANVNHGVFYSKIVLYYSELLKIIKTLPLLSTLT